MLAVPCCAPVARHNVEQGFESRQELLRDVSIQLRRGFPSHGAISVSPPSNKAGECTFRAEVSGSGVVSFADRHRLCELVRGLGLRAGIDREETVWVPVWDNGTLGNDGGYVQPGAQLRARIQEGRDLSDFSYRQFGDSGWFAYEFHN